ncbi:hypothetical protein [Metabacillus fastidiosus]|uniref:Uncharacterized protein n=1 Tax=Metabacillus fastidiosus TaxID=1458 RepID=A0ABU6NY17_9BACI|nr:hypothetical protein [Metabacillus fastidiosus]MED4401583.1 hypothetical protein [Metabacillus fastidiosus]MED4463218.1 hypothetical protein [Metabacillus fastidiosus]
MKNSLKEKIYAQGYPDAKTAPIVSLEDFFEADVEESSIGCNLLEHPGIFTFHKILFNIRSKINVQDVFVEIMEIEDDLIFSERIYILTDSHISEIIQWIEPLQPTEIDEGYTFGKPSLAPELRADYKVFSVWWD